MVIKLSPETRKEVASTIEDYGYKSEREFIEDALRHRILELKKAEFFTKIKEIRKRISKIGLTEREILKDFEQFSHN